MAQDDREVLKEDKHGFYISAACALICVIAVAGFGVNEWVSGQERPSPERLAEMKRDYVQAELKSQVWEQLRSPGQMIANNTKEIYEAFEKASGNDVFQSGNLMLGIKIDANKAEEAAEKRLAEVLNYEGHIKVYGIAAGFMTMLAGGFFYMGRRTGRKLEALERSEKNTPSGPV